MTAIPIDTLKTVERLVAAGVPRAQAAVHADVLREAITAETATIREGNITRDEFTRELAALHVAIDRLNAKVDQLAIALRAEMERDRIAHQHALAALDAKIDRIAAELHAELSQHRSALEAKIDHFAVTLRAELGEQRSALEAKIDHFAVTLRAELGEQRSALEAKIDHFAFTLRAELGEQRSALEAKIDRVADDQRIGLGEVRSELEAKIEANSAHIVRLDTKIDFVYAVLTAKIDANHMAALARAEAIRDELIARIEKEIAGVNKNLAEAKVSMMRWAVYLVLAQTGFLSALMVKLMH